METEAAGPFSTTTLGVVMLRECARAPAHAGGDVVRGGEYLVCLRSAHRESHGCARACSFFTIPIFFVAIAVAHGSLSDGAAASALGILGQIAIALGGCGRGAAGAAAPSSALTPLRRAAVLGACVLAPLLVLVMRLTRCARCANARCVFVAAAGWVCRGVARH